MQALGVADHLRGQMVIKAGGKRQSLLGGSRGDQIKHLRHGVGQVERLRVNRELAGLDARQVEQFIDRGQHDARAACGGVGIGALLGVQAGILHERNRAHHAVQRRADLVAHEGQEVALFLVGAIGVAAGGDCLALGLHARRHVMLDAHEGDQPTGAVEYRGHAQFIDEAAAILAVVGQLNADRLALHDGAAKGVDALLLGAHALQEAAVAAEDFMRFVAGDLLEGRVDEDQRAVGQVGVSDDNAGGGRRNRQRQRAVEARRRDGLERASQPGVAAGVEDDLRALALTRHR